MRTSGTYPSVRLKEHNTTLGSPRTPRRSQENPSQTTGIDPRRAPYRWISIGGIIFEPTPAVGDHPGDPPGVITISMILVRLGLMGYEYLKDSLAIFNSGFCLPGRGPGPSQIGFRGAGIGTPGPGESLARNGPRSGRPRWGTTSATLRVSR